MLCEIQWNSLSVEAWESRFAAIARSNILQSYDYALASAKLNRQRARWGLIMMDGKEAGLVQILEAGQWSSPAFLRYLDKSKVDRDAVVEAHIGESSSDEDM